MTLPQFLFMYVMVLVVGVTLVIVDAIVDESKKWIKWKDLK